MKGKRKLPKILEIDEEQQLLNWTRQNRTFRDYVVILSILRTGLRTNELRELLISDVSIDGKILTHLKERKIPIPNDLREQLLAFLEWKEQHGESIEPMSFLFASAKSPQVTVRHLQRIIRESTIGALGKAYRVNDLRRTFEYRISNDDKETIPSSSPASTNEIPETAETTYSLSPPIHPIDGEYIREWLVLGPFFPDDLEKDFLADVGGEENIQPQEGDIVTTEDGRELTWQRYQTKENGIDISDTVGKHKCATAYAFCVLQMREAIPRIGSEVEGDAQIYLGSNCGITIWINDKQVHSNSVEGRLTLDRDTLEVHLKAGVNRCLIKLSQRFGPWEFALRMTMLHPNRAVISGTITDEKGKPIPNADVRLEHGASHRSVVPLCRQRGLQDDLEIAQTAPDASGSYRLNIHPVRGQYDLSAISGDLGDWRLGIQLDKGERRTQNFTLKEAISIEGTLLMLDDATPHVAVPVQAICSEEVIATTLSDESGKYRFINLKPGRYQLRCQVLGGYVYYKTTDDASRFSNFSLERKVRSKETGGTATEKNAGEVLSVEQGKTLKNINFRFAHFKKGTWRNYDTLDGLGSSVVSGISRDPDGVMWFATDGGGVSRYDGKTLVNLTTKDGLVNNVVRAIYCDPDGVMWFGTFGGVSRYDGNQFINLTIEDGLAWATNRGVRAINSDANGMMWFGTRGGGISRYDGKTFVNFTTKDGLAGNSVRAIHRTPDGVMWFGTDGGGISRYDGNQFVNFTRSLSPLRGDATATDGLVNNRVNAIHHDSDGVMWFGTDGGVSRYDGKTFVNLTTEDGLVSNHVIAIYCGSDGVIWFGTSSGVSRYDGKTFVNFTRTSANSVANGLASNIIRAIYCDPDGVMWFGTGTIHHEQGGVSRYDEKTFTNFTTKDGLAHNTVWDIDCASSLVPREDSCDNPDGAMWFATNNGVSQYDGSEFANFIKKDELVYNRILSIACAPDGVIWIGTERDGAYRYANPNARLRLSDGKKFVNFTTKDGLAANYVNDIHCDEDGVIWFATDGGGVSRYDGKTFVNLTTEDGLVNDSIWSINRDHNGVMWFGGFGMREKGGLSRYDGNQFINFTTEDGLADNFVTAIHCDPDGMMWFGTAGGVSRYDGNQFINLTTEDGLASNWVLAIHRDEDGVMWFATDGGGISWYDGITWTSLDTRDGLAGNRVASIFQDLDGYLWFGTDNGITRYRRNTVLPKAKIVSVTTDETYFDLDAIPAFTIGTRVTIEYNSIDLKTLPEKRQYRCRIVEIPPNPPLRKGGTSGIDLKKGGNQGDWCKPTKATSFDYTFDESGDYTFEVQAIDRDLNYSEPATVNLTIQADFRLVALQTEVNHLRREVGRKYHFSNIIGRAAEIKRMYTLMEKAIDSGLTALITGETGTGKDLVAKAIHYNSPRKNKPLIERNCGALPKDLVASELFGHRKGAFTSAHEDKIGLFEAAEGGTLILDEIGEMSEEAQTHLLRVLQERKVQRVGETQLRDVDVRVIAVTNRDLEADVKAGRFREDLYFRLSVFPIHVPPLRERVDDIPLLSEHFLREACQEQKKEIDGFTPDVMDMLMSYPWPGNVRELEHEIARAVALVDEGPDSRDVAMLHLHIQTYHFSPKVTREESLMQDVLSESSGYAETVDSFRRRFIKQVLSECGGNRHEAARRLRMHRPNLISLMRRLGINGDEV